MRVRPRPQRAHEKRTRSRAAPLHTGADSKRCAAAFRGKRQRRANFRAPLPVVLRVTRRAGRLPARRATQAQDTQSRLGAAG